MRCLLSARNHIPRVASGRAVGNRPRRCSNTALRGAGREVLPADANVAWAGRGCTWGIRPARNVTLSKHHENGFTDALIAKAVCFHEVEGVHRPCCEAIDDHSGGIARLDWVQTIPRVCSRYLML